MIYRLFALLMIAAGVAGCASNSDYGVRPSPLVQELEGEGGSGSLEQEVTAENLRAQEEQQEPIFTYEDSGMPE